MVVGWIKKVKHTEIRDFGGDGQEDEQAGADGLMSFVYESQVQGSCRSSLRKSG